MNSDIAMVDVKLAVMEVDLHRTIVTAVAQFLGCSVGTERWAFLHAARLTRDMDILLDLRIKLAAQPAEAAAVS